jgi:hypothetical protein
MTKTPKQGFDPQLQGAICQRLHVFGVPPCWHKKFASCVDRWVKCSGVDWTVKRLKSLKVDLFRDRSGLKPLTPAARNSKGEFSGVIGSLFRYSRKSERTFQSVIHTFMCYSLFKHQKLTDAQQEKFMVAVNATTNKCTEDFLQSFATFVRSRTQRKIRIGEPSPIIFHRGSESKKAPLLAHRSVPQNQAGLSSLAYFATDAHYELWCKYEPLYGKVTDGVDITTLKASVRSCDLPFNKEVQGGEIHFLQEPGLKLRAIASPHLVHQEALRPLGSALYSFMHTLPWDCTHDHKKPVSHVQEHLSSKRIIHSVDLSNATDYFPLEVQVKALTALIGHHPSIDLFIEISRSQWQSAIGPIRWSQGQPLGLYPSFASFGLTHGYLLLYLLGKRYENEFYVLGDDVIILDTALYDKYIAMLDILGCPYSPDKSLSSSELCEFAGKIITSKSVIPSYKWREVSNDNFLDIVRNYGKRSVVLLSSIQKKVVERVQHLVTPIGLNWSYPGSNLESMTEATNQVYRQIDRVEQSLTELYSTLNKNWYCVPTFQMSLLPSLLKWSVNSDRILELASTFDEKVAVTLRSVFPEEWVAAIQENNLEGGYSGVPRAVGITDLPLVTETPARSTTLDRLRKLLHL